MRRFFGAMNPFDPLSGMRVLSCHHFRSCHYHGTGWPSPNSLFSIIQEKRQAYLSQIYVGLGASFCGFCAWLRLFGQVTCFVPNSITFPGVLFLPSLSLTLGKLPYFYCLSSHKLQIIWKHPFQQALKSCALTFYGHEAPLALPCRSAASEGLRQRIFCPLGDHPDGSFLDAPGLGLTTNAEKVALRHAVWNSKHTVSTCRELDLNNTFCTAHVDLLFIK